MQDSSLTITIITSLVSGLLGVLVSYYFMSKLEVKKIKIDTARRILGYRYDISSDGFQQAMNEVFIVFAKSKPVIKAMDEFWTVLQTPKEYLSNDVANDKLINFLKEICKDVGISHKDIFDYPRLSA